MDGEAAPEVWRVVCIPSFNRGFLRPPAGLTAAKGRKANKP
jgi:hypothetical protein